MTAEVGRHHWLNTYVGIIDSAFHLSDEELYGVTDIIRKLLIVLRVPERGRPAALPVPLAHEVDAAYYERALSARDHGPTPAARPMTDGEVGVTLEAWREALTGMLTDAYPALGPEARLTLVKVMGDLLASIGVPARAATFHPQLVINAHNSLGLSR